MNNKTLETYIEARAQVEGEIIRLDGQIAALKDELKLLETELAELNEALNGQVPTRFTLKRDKEATPEQRRPVPVNLFNSQARDLVAYLKKSPGVDRQTIQIALGLDEQTARNLVSRMSKRGAIENRGNKRYAKYYVPKGIK
jgi:predicted HTH transcriptional regulator